MAAHNAPAAAPEPAGRCPMLTGRLPEAEAAYPPIPASLPGHPSAHCRIRHRRAARHLRHATCQRAVAVAQLLAPPAPLRT